MQAKLVIAACVLMSTTAWATDRKPDEIARELVEGATAVTAAKVELSAEDRATIARAVGREPSAPAPEVLVFDADVERNGKTTYGHAAIVTAKGSKGEFRVGLAVGAKGDVEKVHVYGLDGPAASERFVRQFAGAAAYCKFTPTSWEPVATLAEKRKLAQGSTEEGKRLRALFAIRDRMVPFGFDSSLLSQGIKEGAALSSLVARAKSLDARATDLPSLAADVGGILDAKEVEAFRRAAEDQKKPNDDLRAAVEAGKKDGLAELVSTQQRTCENCHSKLETHYGKAMYSTARDLREQNGIGPGYFVMWHDVWPPPAATPEAVDPDAQVVAFAVKEAILVLKKQ